MRAAVGLRRPTLGELRGERPVLRGERFVAAQAAQLREGAERDDGLGREIDVVSEMTREVVGGQLILRIEALVAQVLGPLGQHRPVATGEVTVPFHLPDPRYPT